MTDAPAPRTRKTWDLVLTIVLLVSAIVVAVLLSFTALFLVFMTDSCAGECNSGLMSLGIIVGFVTPYIGVLLGIAGAVVLLIFKRRAFWVGIVAIALAAGGFALGTALVYAGLPSS